MEERQLEEAVERISFVVENLERKTYGRTSHAINDRKVDNEIKAKLQGIIQKIYAVKEKYYE